MRAIRDSDQLDLAVLEQLCSNLQANLQANAATDDEDDDPFGHDRDQSRATGYDSRKLAELAAELVMENFRNEALSSSEEGILLCDCVCGLLRYF